MTAKITESKTRTMTWDRAGLGKFEVIVTDGQVTSIDMRLGDEININSLVFAASVCGINDPRNLVDGGAPMTAVAAPLVRCDRVARGVCRNKSCHHFTPHEPIEYKGDGYTEGNSLVTGNMTCMDGDTCDGHPMRCVSAAVRNSYSTGQHCAKFIKRCATASRDQARQNEAALTEREDRAFETVITWCDTYSAGQHASRHSAEIAEELLTRQLKGLLADAELGARNNVLSPGRNYYEGKVAALRDALAVIDATVGVHQ